MRKFEIFIANKFIRDHNSGEKTRPIIRISIIAVALSCAIMILTAAVVRGFKKEISEKVIGFGSHIRITHFENQTGYEAVPIERDSFVEHLGFPENVAKVQSYIAKPGILKKGKLFTTNVLKGVGPDFDWQFFQKHLVKGQLSANDDGIVVSSKSARELDADVGDEVLLYFIQDPPRMRKLKITAIYSSGFAQFDELISLTGMDMLRKLNDWNENQISGYEILVDDFDRLDETNDFIYAGVPSTYNASTIMEEYPDIFNWLELQDVNFVIIVMLMLLVAAINMISALIILIIERSPAIGILKTLGTMNASIRRIFIMKAGYLLITGMVWGNVAGISLCLIQKYFRIITLPVESYYLSAVPISIEFNDLFLINMLTALICLVLLIIPSYLISQLNLVKVIRFR